MEEEIIFSAKAMKEAINLARQKLIEEIKKEIKKLDSHWDIDWEAEIIEKDEVLSLLSALSKKHEGN